MAAASADGADEVANAAANDVAGVGVDGALPDPHAAIVSETIASVASEAARAALNTGMGISLRQWVVEIRARDGGYGARRRQAAVVTRLDGRAIGVVAA